MNRTMPYLQCEKTFGTKVRAFGLGEHLDKLKGLHIKTIGAMASSCTWDPESTTDALLKEKILMTL